MKKDPTKLPTARKEARMASKPQARAARVDEAAALVLPHKEGVASSSPSSSSSSSSFSSPQRQ